MLKLNSLSGFGSGVSGAVASVSGYFGGGSSYGVGIGIGEIVSEVHREMYGVGFGDVGVDGPYYCFP